MIIVFSHGRNTKPDDLRIVALRQIAHSHGIDSISIDYTHLPSPEDRVEHLKHKFLELNDDVALVGVSMGGYVSVLANEAQQTKGLFLLAPAFYIDTYAVQSYKQIDVKPFDIVHGWEDDVVPADNSIRFAQTNRCDLHMIHDNHLFEHQFSKVKALFEYFLLRISM